MLNIVVASLYIGPAVGPCNVSNPKQGQLVSDRSVSVSSRSPAPSDTSCVPHQVDECELFKIVEIFGYPPIVALASDLRKFGVMRDIKVGISAVAKSDEVENDVSKSSEILASSCIGATPDIEKEYVHCVYDAIAPHFSVTRFAKWPKVAGFINSLSPGQLILDAGCGNGKYLGLNPNCFYIGCDISSMLVGICADRGHEVLVADALNLPYRSGFGDAAISIAVLHHLSTEERRTKAITELIRVVKKGGVVLITVWAVEQEDKKLLNKWTPLTEKYIAEWNGPSSPRARGMSTITLESILETDDSKSQADELLEPAGGSSSASSNGKKDENHQEYFVPWHLPYHRAEISGASANALASGLAQKDDKKGAVVYNRYYHVFSEGELERLVKDIGNAVIVDQFYDKSNWCIILKRIS